MDAKVRKKKGRHERNKLNVKQVAGLTQPGIYSDGGGLYVRVRNPGTRSWVFIYTLHGKRQEMGLGSLLDITLAKARERAAGAREKVLEGVDPKDAHRQEIAQLPAKPPVTFGEFAFEYIASIEESFKNRKHRQQWRNTLKTYAVSSWSLPIDEVKTEHVLAAVQPIWLTKAETASRVRERMEKVLDAAKVKGLREGENPARLRGHLDLLLPKRKKSEQHHPALPYTEIADFLGV